MANITDFYRYDWIYHVTKKGTARPLFFCCDRLHFESSGNENELFLFIYDDDDRDVLPELIRCFYDTDTRKLTATAYGRKMEFDVFVEQHRLRLRYWGKYPRSMHRPDEGGDGDPVNPTG